MHIFLACDMVLVMECNNVMRNKVIPHVFVICDIITGTLCQDVFTSPHLTVLLRSVSTLYCMNQSTMPSEIFYCRKVYLHTQGLNLYCALYIELF